jgi:steroid delta-isomerase-like uncharacterized protein
MAELTEHDARRFVELANSRDPDQLLQEFAEDGTFQNGSLLEPLKGKEAIRDFFRTGLSAFPDFHIEPKKIVVSGNEILQLDTQSGTHEGPFPGPDGKPIAPTHRKWSVEGMTHIVVDSDGKIRSLRGYGNPLELYKQLGLSP